MNLTEHALKLALVIKESSPFMLDNLRRQFSKLFGAVELLSKSTRNWKDGIISLTKYGITGLLISIASAAKIMIMLDDRMTILGQRFGMTGEQIRQFSDNLYKVSAASGIVVDQLGEVAHELIEAGFKGRTKELAELSASVFKFSEFTGISLKTSANFTAELSRLGINSLILMDKLATLRRGLQLSTQEFESVIKTAEQAAKAVYAFGDAAGKNSAQNINTFSEGLANLSAEMQNTGVSSEVASKLLSGLMDPLAMTRGDPALRTMWLNMGLSINEVADNLSGVNNSFSKTDEMLGRVRSSARLLASDPYFLSMMAQHGIAADQIKLLAYGMESLSPAQQKLINEQKTLNELQAAMGSTIKPLQLAWRSFFSNFILAIKPAIDLITSFLTNIGNGIKTVSNLFKDVNGETNTLGKVMKGIFGAIILVGLGALIISLGVITVNMYKGISATGLLSKEMGVLAASTTAAAGAYTALGAAMGGVNLGTGAGAAVSSAATLAKARAAMGLAPILTTVPTVASAGGGLTSLIGLVKGLGTALTAVAKSPLGKLFLVGGAVMTGISVLGSKKFKIGDLGSICMALGLIPGMQMLLPIGAALLGIGMLLDLVSGGKWGTIFSWGPGGLKFGSQPTAEEIKQKGIADTNGIQKNQEEMSFIGQDRSFTTYASIEKLLKDLKEEAKLTNKAINTQTGVQKTSAEKQMDADKVNKIFNSNSAKNIAQGAGRGSVQK